MSPGTPRDAILARIRAATATRGDPPAPTAPLPVRTLRDPSATNSELFASHLEAVAGVCHRASTIEAAADALRAIIADHRAKRVARSNDPVVIQLLERVVGTFELSTPASPRDDLLASDVGLCRAVIGIAEHGTIVLPSGMTDPASERTRLVALLPRVHVAILRPSDIVGTLAEAIERLHPVAPTVTFATGPSRTADIEQELVVGVHGPHAQHVILLEH